jgi:hypothetical protein
VSYSVGVTRIEAMRASYALVRVIRVNAVIRCDC